MTSPWSASGVASSTASRCGCSARQCRTPLRIGSTRTFGGACVSRSGPAGFGWCLPDRFPEPVTLANMREQNAPRNGEVVAVLRRYRLARAGSAATAPRCRPPRPRGAHVGCPLRARAGHRPFAGSTADAGSSARFRRHSGPLGACHQIDSSANASHSTEPRPSGCSRSLSAREGCGSSANAAGRTTSCRTRREADGTCRRRIVAGRRVVQRRRPRPTSRAVTISSKMCLTARPVRRTRERVVGAVVVLMGGSFAP